MDDVGERLGGVAAGGHEPADFFERPEKRFLISCCRDITGPQQDPPGGIALGSLSTALRAETRWHDDSMDTMKASRVLPSFSSCSSSCPSSHRAHRVPARRAVDTPVVSSQWRNRSSRARSLPARDLAQNSWIQVETGSSPSRLSCSSVQKCVLCRGVGH